MPQSRTALVVGARGVIGRGLVEELTRQGGWQIIGLSRRGATDTAAVQHVAVDLLDPEGVKTGLRDVARDVTHVFYAAFQDAPTWSGLVAPNLRMLRSTLDAVEASAHALEHVSLMQGYKVYGAHLGPFKTPARESDAGHMPPEFNLEQQALLAARSTTATWTWSAIRPAVVAGVALGNPMNLLMGLATYGTIAKELGVPFRFPGRPGTYDRLIEITDAGLLARATIWAATEPRAAGEAFNVGNGDLFRWSELWPKLAASFDLQTDSPLPMPLSEVMGDKAELWDSIVAKHELRPTPYDEMAAWPFVDGVLSWDWDMFGDSSKLRRFGFHEYVETDKLLVGLFDELRAQRLIP